MSGGHFDYKYAHLFYLAEEIEKEIGLSLRQGKFAYSKPTLNIFAETVKALYHFGEISKEIEWLCSADTDEAEFLKRVKEIKNKYLIDADK